MLATAAMTLAWMLAAATPPAAPEHVPGLQNFFRATPRVFSGSQPEGNAAFATLARLGVKTILSVDGAKPDHATASRHGLRYVHLPVGYGGIATNRVTELVKLAQTAAAPIYVHCHHGKHRGPAATAIMGLGREEWSPSQAVSFLKVAGTSPEYRGLYRAVSAFVMPAPGALAAASTNFTAHAQTSTLVETMVAIDAHYEHLEAAARAGWQAPASHPDLAPGHEALLLWEQLHELARVPDTTARGDAYRQVLAAAERAAGGLRDALQGAARDASLARAAFQQLGQACAQCHQKYRNE